MDELKRYNQHIRSMLLNGVQKRVDAENNVQNKVNDPVVFPKGGNMKHKSHIDELLHGRKNTEGKVLTDNTNLPYTYENLDENHILEKMYDKHNIDRLEEKPPNKRKPRKMNSEDNDDMEGGRFNFVKTMKNLGHTLGHDARTVGSTVKNVALKTGSTLAGQEIGKAVYNGLKTFGTKALQGAETVGETALADAPAIAETGAEVAPLALAAGMKKSRKHHKKEKDEKEDGGKEKKEKKPRKKSEYSTVLGKLMRAGHSVQQAHKIIRDYKEGKKK